MITFLVALWDYIKFLLLLLHENTILFNLKLVYYDDRYQYKRGCARSGMLAFLLSVRMAKKKNGIPTKVKNLMFTSANVTNLLAL